MDFCHLFGPFYDRLGCICIWCANAISGARCFSLGVISVKKKCLRSKAVEEYETASICTLCKPLEPGVILRAGQSELISWGACLCERGGGELKIQVALLIASRIVLADSVRVVVFVSTDK